MNTKRTRIFMVTAIVVVAIAGLFLLNSDPVSAERTTIPEIGATGVAGETGSYTGFSTTVLPSLTKILSALVIVVFCIYMAIYLLKKLLGRRYNGRGGMRILEVLETTSVAPKKTVSLIRVADKSVLVGICDSQMSVLTELDADETARILAAEEETSVAADHFQGIFSVATQKLKELGQKRKAEVAQA